MKNHQDYLSGSMRIHIRGTLIEPFLQACTKRGCSFTHLYRMDEGTVEVTVRLQDWKTIRSLRKKYRCRIDIVEGMGAPFLLKRMMKQTSLLLAFVAAILLIFTLSNTLWSVKVKGLNPELEASVEQKLTEYGVSPGKLMFSMKDPNQIQRLLLDEVEDLLWIGVKRQGTSYHLYGVEKTIQEPEEEGRPANLVAAKKGMIVKSFIKKGRPLVSVFDVVKKGQVLATGQLVDEGDKYIKAEGEVIAETWYKVEQTIPLSHILQLTRGETLTDYHLVMGSFELPLWGWWHKSKGEHRVEGTISDAHLLGWKLPVQLKTEKSYELDEKSLKATMKQLVKQGIETAKKSLSQELEPEAVIKEEKVLHQKEDNGKVKLILLIKVHENIAETKFISQGD